MRRPAFATLGALALLSLAACEAERQPLAPRRSSVSTAGDVVALANATPVAKITAPATNLFILTGQSVSFAGQGTDADGTIRSYAWSFSGGSPGSSTLQNPGSVKYASTGAFTASLTVTDNVGAHSAAATRVVTVRPAVVSVSVADFAFNPKTPTVAYGATVRWSFQGPSTHNATDVSGMSLFASGNKTAGTQYSFAFVGAGAYAYHCSIHPSMTGTVNVPMTATPTSGRVTTSFAVTWAAGAPASGFVYDVQIKRPTATGFVNWKVGQVARSATFVPDGGTGSYSFRARLRKPAVSKASSYSPATTISVS